MRLRWAIPFVCMILLLTACGPKNSEDVISDLADRSSNLDSYLSHGTMTINSGQEPQKIEIEVWYQKPDFYRVALTNKKKNITQILLKNKQGVYVLTPHLKKSFRFQSDWPANSGQIYLYQSILQNVLADQKRQFTANKKDYRFDIATNSNYHQTWIKQQIWLDHDYLPKKIHILDENSQVMVAVNYDKFKLDASFDKDAFDMERNLRGLPEDADAKQTMAELNQPLASVTPGYLPKGSQLVNEETIRGNDGPIAVMRFSGKHPFTITERKAKAQQASMSLTGNPVDLHDAEGVWMTLVSQQHLSWTVNGMDFELVGNLPIEEMKKIADSMGDQPAK